MRTRTEIAPVRSESSLAIEAKIDRADAGYRRWRELESKRREAVGVGTPAQALWRFRAYHRATQNLYRWDRIKTRLICDLYGIDWRKPVPA